MKKPLIIFFTLAIVGLGMSEYGTTVPAEALNPSMTKEVLCAEGFTTKSVRPAAYLTNKIKKEMLSVYEQSFIPNGYKLINSTLSVSDFQLDHRVSLCAGGSPLNNKNFELQPLEIAHKKDLVEKELCRKICKDEISLKKAQSILYNSWEDYYKKNFGGLKNLGSILENVVDIDDN